ncbi:MAG: hypothetical protein QOJ47_2021, partial [Gaiellales bacterium]|nr:hypothetical protein [Gaiellales bacterium]
VDSGIIWESATSSVRQLYFSTTTSKLLCALSCKSPSSMPATTTSARSPGSAAVGGGRIPANGTSLVVTRPKTTTTSADRTLLGAPSATPVLDHLAPAHAGDLPVAVIVLGALASLLVLAGIAGAILRRRATRSGS